MKRRVPLGVWIGCLISVIRDEFDNRYTEVEKERFRTTDTESNPDVRAGYLMGYNDALVAIRKRIPPAMLRDVRVDENGSAGPPAHTLN